MTILHKQNSMFAGAITPIGFVDYFSNIMPLKSAKQRYFIKGASGSGKSIFIQEVARAVEAAGHTVERFYCANDAKSLDAMACHSLGLAIIDATRPHICDPEIPTAIDHILDFGAFLNKEKLAPHINEIIQLLDKKKEHTNRAFTHMAALNYHNAHKPNIIPNSPSFFLNAITPDGHISFADGYFKNSKMYTTDWEYFLQSGERAINFCNIFSPNTLDYLYFPDKKVAFEFCEGDKTPKTDDAIQAMYTARGYHVKLEAIYGSAMDFNKVDHMVQKLIMAIAP